METILSEAVDQVPGLVVFAVFGYLMTRGFIAYLRDRDQLMGGVLQKIDAKLDIALDMIDDMGNKDGKKKVETHGLGD